MTHLKSSPKADTSKVKKTSARQTKPDQLKKMLSRKAGSSINEIQKKFGWQPHSARAALSSLRKAGHVIVRSDTDTGPTYRMSTLEVVR